MELITILAPTIGGYITNFIKGRGKELKYTELQVLLLAKSIEDIAVMRETVTNFNRMFLNHIEQENITLKAIQAAMELISENQRRLRVELIESGAIK